MAEYIKTLKEDNGDITYPQTVGGAVLLTGGSDLETTLAGKASTADVNGKISIGDVQYTDLVANSVRTAAIQDGSVTTAKIANDAVTKDKMDYTGYGRFERDLGTSSQSFSAGTETTVLVPREVVPDSGCTYSSGVITITQPGIWIIRANMRMSPSGAYTGYGRIKHTPSGDSASSVALASGTGYANSSTTATYWPMVVWFGHLATGDKVFFTVTCSAACSNSSNAQQRFGGICLMPD